MEFSYSHHLVDLVARAAAASARLADADPDRRRRVAAAARREAARVSVRLDGSPLTDDTAAAVDEGVRTGVSATASQVDRPAGGWAAALKLDGMANQELAAREYANALRAANAEDELAPQLLEDPLRALTRLHGCLVEGLVDPAVVGRPRRTEQAVLDGAQGRVLYRSAPPDRVPALLDELTGWLVRRAAAVPAVVAAGVVHERLLEWQPFEAANGRLARAAAGCVLRARGVDPDGVAVTERALASDAAGYYGEVAATIRRRGRLGPWLERHTGAVVAGLEHAVDAVTGRPPPDLPARARAVAASLAAGEPLTVADYAERAGVPVGAARADLLALVRAGELTEDPGGRGLRFLRPSGP